MTIKELYELAKEKNMEDYTLTIYYECMDDYYSIFNDEVENIKFDEKTKEVNMSIRQKGENKNENLKKIEIELTPEEEQIILKARDVIDTIINEMNEHKLTTIISDYDTYDEGGLDAIATELHSLATIYEGE